MLYSTDRYGPVTKNVIIKLGNQTISQIDENSDVGNYKILFTATDVNNTNNQIENSIDILVYDTNHLLLTIPFNFQNC